MKNMTEGEPLKLIIPFMIPLLIGNVFQQLYNIADIIIVGRTIGVNALAAVGATAPLFMGRNFLPFSQRDWNCFSSGRCLGRAVPGFSYTSILAQKLILSFVYFSEKQFSPLRNLILNVK